MSISFNTGYSNDLEELRRKRLEEQNAGVPQVEVTPPDQDEGSAAKFNEKYNTNSIFGVDPSANTPNGVQRFTTASASAASSGGTSLVNDADPNSMSGSVFNAPGMDVNNPNIQPGALSAIGGAPVTTPGAIQQPSGSDRGESPDNAASGQSQGKPRFSGSDVLNLTGGLGPGSEISLNFNLDGIGGGQPTGEGMLSAENPTDGAGGADGTGGPNGAPPSDDSGNVDGTNPEDVGEPPKDPDEEDPTLKTGDDSKSINQEEMKQQEELRRQKEEEEAAKRNQPPPQ